MPERLLRARDVAEILQVDARTIYRWAEYGTLPCVRLSDHVIRFDPAAVAEWVRDRSNGNGDGR